MRTERSERMYGRGGRQPVVGDSYASDFYVGTETGVRSSHELFEADAVGRCAPTSTAERVSLSSISSTV